MALGGVPHNSDTYDRSIILLDTDGTTVVETLCNLSANVNKVDAASFEWRRLGGCGTGNFSIARSFADRGAFEIGQHIICRYTNASTPWYFGRIEEVVEDSPGGTTLRTEGLISVLNDNIVGGKLPYYGNAPREYARQPGIFPGDPDKSYQTFETATYFHSVVEKFYTNHIAPLGFGLDVIEHPDEEIDFYTMVFRGEESIAEVLRTFSVACYGASYGINANGEFFFLKRPTTATHSFKEGHSVASLSRKQDRDLMFNYMNLLGDYIYVPPSLGAVQHYRFQGVYYDEGSINSYGPKRIELYVPFVRTNPDAIKFIQGFFNKYGTPYRRCTFETLGQASPMFPWAQSLTLLDKAGATIVADEIFDNVKVDFNEAPTFTITTGPESLQFPTAPAQVNQELPQNNNQGGIGLPSFTIDSTTYVPPPTCACPDGMVGIRFDECDNDGQLKVCIESDLVKECKCSKNIVVLSLFDSSTAYANICTYEDVEVGGGAPSCPVFTDCVKITRDYSDLDPENEFFENCPNSEESFVYLTRTENGPIRVTPNSPILTGGPWRVFYGTHCTFFDTSSSQTISYRFSVVYSESEERWYYGSWTVVSGEIFESSEQVSFHDGDETWEGTFLYDAPGDSSSGTVETIISLSQDCGSLEPSDAGVVPPDGPGDCVYDPLEVDIEQFNTDKGLLEAAIDPDFPLVVGNVQPGFTCWSGTKDALVPAGEPDPQDSLGSFEFAMTGTDEDNRYTLSDLQDMITTLYGKLYPTGPKPNAPFVFLIYVDDTGSAGSFYLTSVYSDFEAWLNVTYPDVTVKWRSQSGGGNGPFAERWIKGIADIYTQEINL